MPIYSNLHKLIRNKDAKARAAENLLRLKEQMQGSVPEKDAEENLLLATWNIRNFGRKNPFGWGNRLPESWFYIAEIISNFDLVAVQEVTSLDEWEKVMRILGSHWDYIATDVADRAAGGNGERMVFVYDTRKVSFRNVAGEIVLPPSMLISRHIFDKDKEKLTAGEQFDRTPFLVSFQADWLKLDLCTVHIHYGSDSEDDLRERSEEINAIAKYLSKTADKKLRKNISTILLGDFNIFGLNHPTMQALENNNFVIPDVLKNKTTTGTGKHYDQIAFKTKAETVEYVDTPGNGNAGVVDLFKSIMTDDHYDIYKELVRKTTSSGKKADSEEKLFKAYKKWRTYQLSDHYLMWVRLKTNNSRNYLRSMLTDDFRD